MIYSIDKEPTVFRLLRKLNLLLFLLALWQGYLLWNVQPANAQPAKFLGRPYYGGGQWGIARTASMDHDLPNYDKNGVFVNYDGQTSTTMPCPNLCYDGHPAFDIALNYQPVVASANGTIVYAGWENPNNHDGINLGLISKIQHNNNHQTIYGHLSEIRYMTGRTVGRWQIGTSGTTGNSSGPHLHFEVLRWHNNAYRVTDPYGWNGTYADPNSNTNGPSYWLWLDMPDRELPVPNRTTLHTVDDGAVNDTTDRFDISCLSGGASGFGTGSTGNAINSDLYWTFTEGTGVDCWVNWRTPNLPSSGQYEVEVYVPLWSDVTNQSHATRAHAARYRIIHANGEETIVLDQHRIGYSRDANQVVHWTGPGVWISLGRYDFSAGLSSTQLVQLADTAFVPANSTYGQPLDSDQGRLLVIDAVRWVRIQ